MSRPGISKSRFTDYIKCARLGYLSSFPKRFLALRDPFDWATEQRLLTGLRAGELARNYFPGGVLVSRSAGELEEAVRETKDLVAAGVDAIYEATFAYEDILVRADILRRVGEAEFELIEVKATNDYKKAEHLPDVGIQLYVLEAAGLTVPAVKLMHFDKSYRYPGGNEYDPWALFMLEDVTADARRYVNDILPGKLGAFRALLAQREPPRELVKNRCREECQYYRQVCLPTAPEYPVTELGGRYKKLLAALLDDGIYDLREVNQSYPGLNEQHILMLQAVQRGGLQVLNGLANHLRNAVSYPVAFMDFETYNPGFPIFAGMGPWQHIPFQWSLHILDQEGPLEHHGFLAQDSRDPRRAFVETLLRTLPPMGTVIVYNKDFEVRRLEELAETFPDLSEALLAIEPRMHDLLETVADSCYHPEFHGSRSLKAVLPVLVPGLGYQDLDIAEGTEAMAAYAEILDEATNEERRQALTEQLRAYCAMDTLALVEIFRFLTQGRE